MRSFLASAITLAAALVSGCGPDCPPEPDITVTMDQNAELAQTLPILPSGAVQLLETDVPDSHGDFALNVRMTNTPDVIAEGLTLSLQVDGQDIEVTPTRTQQGDADFAVNDEAQNQGTLRFFWRPKNLADYQLAAGKTYTAKVSMPWRFAGCRTQTGVAEGTVTGTIKDPDNVKNITVTSTEAGRVDVLRGIKTKFTVGTLVGNDTLVGLTPKYTLTFFDEGLPPTLGFGIADASKIAMQQNGQPRSLLAPGESIEVYTSTNRGIGGAPYDHAGSAASTATLVGPGKAVVKFEMTSQRAAGSTTQNDVVYRLIDVP